MVGIEAAGVGQYPHGRRLQRLGLEPGRRARPIERDAVGAYAYNGDTSGTKTAELPGESSPAGAELIICEFRGSGGRPGYQVRDADALLE
jgi:hypothetical protein